MTIRVSDFGLARHSGVSTRDRSSGRSGTPSESASTQLTAARILITVVGMLAEVSDLGVGGRDHASAESTVSTQSRTERPRVSSRSAATSR